MRNKRNTPPWFSIFIIAVFVLSGIFGSLIMPNDPMAAAITNKFMPPFFIDGGSIEHILGTDYLGRDVLSRIIMGGRISLTIALIAILIGGCFGSLLGLLSGYFGGITDKIIMRACDAMISIPGILFSLLFAISIGPSFLSVVLCIALTIWPRFTKIVRAQGLSLKGSSFVVQSRVMGASNLFIMTRHLLPNQINTIIVILVQAIGSGILMEAGLSFLGLGVQPPNPTWGGMVADGKNTFTNAWWSSTFPALAIMIIVVAFNILGDWSKEKLNPKEGR